MTVFIFLDTNVFLHCIEFTQIRWRDLFEEPKKSENLVIKVPYVVNEELDNLKKKEKQARKIQKKFRELQNKEFKDGIKLEITVFPPKWSSLKDDWAKKLDENVSDCKIIAEILIFKKEHPNNDIYFFTSDNTPFFQAKALGINSIFWRDNEYNNIFKPIKPEKITPKKLSDLRIFFKNDLDTFNLTPQEEFTIEKFISKNFPDYIFLLDEKSQENKIETEKEFNNIEHLNSEDISKNNMKKSSLISPASMSKMFSEISSKFFTKTDKEFYNEILKYFEEMKDFWSNIEIELYLKNLGNKPYHNVNIDIYTILEKGFEINSAEDLEEPEKPIIKRNLGGFIHHPYIPPIGKKYNVKYSSPQKIKKEKNDIWIFRYSINKIQHQEVIELYPFTIKFPEIFKMKKITLDCQFRHDEEGTTKNQKLILDISMLLN